MDKITIDKKIGGIQIRDIERTDRTRAANMYWLNKGEIELDMLCEIDLEKTRENCNLHFKKPKEGSYIPQPEQLIICYRYGNSYHSKDKNMKTFMEELKILYAAEKANW